MAKRSQPLWQFPQTPCKTELKLYNSLTRQKEIFVPQHGKKILWYCCGPTVYDAAHMGHARSYISFDILRRVLSEYFAYDVFYVMNITDIDDKIIKRARQNYLFDQYARNSQSLSKVFADVTEAVEHYNTLLKATDDNDKKTMFQTVIKKTEEALKNKENLLSSNEIEQVLQNIISNCKDVLSEWLDENEGKNVCDNSIFSALPAQWEEAFFNDMEALNVLQPNAVTRVSEYIPEIIGYVEKIIQNGFAYESNGSVYFNTIKFDQMPDHFYGKLVPEAFGDVKKLQEGEGDLSLSADRLSEKKNPSDFAVWKASKSGEPSWDSPWGKGRPGWHIECSVMASALLGESLDIHTGGFDLKFPHHDNELAQAEAFFNNDHWVRYFLHSGHLTISGCKMSKSLKNFITIQSALELNTSRQIRLAFLLHSWKDTLDYSPQTLDIALHYEKFIMEFFLSAKDSIRDIPRTGTGAFQKWGVEEQNLYAMFQEKQVGVHEALCDNIDTRGAMENIHNLITASNIYINTKKSKHLLCNRGVLTDIMSYISKMLNILGANFGDTSSAISSTNQTSEDTVMPYLRALADFRENTRQKAIEVKATSILKLCDELRDDILPALGVRLEDQEGLKAAIKLVDPKQLAQEKEAKQRIEAEKKLEKERKRKEQEALKAAREAMKKIPPSEMFKAMTDKYSRFDEKGIPSHDAEGKELSESQLKKVIKLYNAQEKKYNDYLKNEGHAKEILEDFNHAS